MNRYLGFDTAIWVRVVGTALTSITGLMLTPFLVMKLHAEWDGAILLPLVMVGIQPFTDMLLSILFGGVADRYGRKRIMMLALLLQALAMLGFAFAGEAWQIALCSMLNGLGRFLFFPAAHAQLSDLVPEGRRAEVYGLVNTAASIGGAIGPLLGIVMYKQNPALVFGLAASTFIIYALLVYRNVPETHAVPITAPQERFRPGEHKALFAFMLLTVPVSLLFVQMESTLPLYLPTLFSDHLSVLGVLMTLHSVLVTLLQLWFARRTEHVSPRIILPLFSLMLGCVGIGFAFSTTLFGLIVFEVLLSVAEMIGFAHLLKLVSIIAPGHMRARYFALFGMHWDISRAFGPLLGGLLLREWGGSLMFALFSALLFISGSLQFWFIQRFWQKSSDIPK